jgi:CheY-like chemotaxis protein
MQQLREIRTLIVDDNDHMRTIVATMLEGLGIVNIRESRDGAHALGVLHYWPADLAIVDFQMSPINGVEFTRLLRQSPGSPNPVLPVIMLTGHAERARVEEARDAGVTEFIVKPVTGNALLTRLNAVIQRPRPFVQAGDFFGPDRRRRKDEEYFGPARRRSDGPAPLEEPAPGPHKAGRG